MTGHLERDAADAGDNVYGAQDEPSGPGRIVLVFQGGGALGAYQVGVYKALHEAGLKPDWVIGTSIGAINASLIAGNAPADRLAALNAFWTRVEDKSVWPNWMPWLQASQSLSFMNKLTSGIPGFFEPNFQAFLGAHASMEAEQAGYYSTAPLEQTLLDLVDFKRLNTNQPRLTVGAAHVCSSRMHYFDSRETEIGVKHIMASGALPPAFPPVRIDGELYWDGGILSNTPTEAVFDDADRRNSLIFAVQLWDPHGQERRTMWDVAHRQKDVQFSSRVASQIVRQIEIHRLRHAIAELVENIPIQLRGSQAVRQLSSNGCLTRMHIVHLVAPRLDHEDQTKDLDFSRSGADRRREAGYANTCAAIKRAPWNGSFDPLEGVILHEPGPGGWSCRTLNASTTPVANGAANI